VGRSRPLGALEPRQTLAELGRAYFPEPRTAQRQTVKWQKNRLIGGASCWQTQIVYATCDRTLLPTLPIITLKLAPNRFGGRPSTIVAKADGRMSSMEKKAERIELLQGTLDMLILKTLLFGPSHGHQIGKHIQRTTNDLLQVQHGSLYPALHRLERKGWIASKWETAPDRNREFKYYRLTAGGRRRLLEEESKWKQMARAVAQIMWPAEEG